MTGKFVCWFNSEVSLESCVLTFPKWNRSSYLHHITGTEPIWGLIIKAYWKVQFLQRFRPHGHYIIPDEFSPAYISTWNYSINDSSFGWPLIFQLLHALIYYTNTIHKPKLRPTLTWIQMKSYKYFNRRKISKDSSRNLYLKKILWAKNSHCSTPP